MKTGYFGKQRSIVTVPSKESEVKMVVESAKKASIMESKGFVGSALHKDGINKRFPFGCSEILSRINFKLENPTIKKVKVVEIPSIKRAEAKALKDAKAACVNKKKLTTIYSNKF